MTSFKPTATASIDSPVLLPSGATLRNRLSKSAMTEGLADPMNRATERHVRLYQRWSEGGAGLLLTGNVMVDRKHLERPGNIAIDNNGGQEQLRALAKAGTVSGNHLWMQLNHSGRQTPIHVNENPGAPSAIPLNLPGKNFGHPRALTESEILDLIKRFANAAMIARDTGFTGVQVHAAHGYLLSSFLSPLANQRTDSWGGSLANRARLLLEVIRAIRQAVGSDFPVSVKLNSADFQKGGFTNEEAIQVVRWLGEEHIDLLELSGGNYEEPGFVGVDSRDAGRKTLRESTLKREAYFLEYAALIKPVATMPIMVTGGFRSKSSMEKALASGATDVIGLARPMCTVPDFPAQLLSGAIENGPKWESELVLAPDALGPNPDPVVFQNVESFGMVYWFAWQIMRLGDGLDPDLKLSLFEAFNTIQQNEAATVAALQR